MKENKKEEKEEEEENQTGLVSTCWLMLLCSRVTYYLPVTALLLSLSPSLPPWYFLWTPTRHPASQPAVERRLEFLP